VLRLQREGRSVPSTRTRTPEATACPHPLQQDRRILGEKRRRGSAVPSLMLRRVRSVARCTSRRPGAGGHVVDGDNTSRQIASRRKSAIATAPAQDIRYRPIQSVPHRTAGREYSGFIARLCHPIREGCARSGQGRPPCERSTSCARDCTYLREMQKLRHARHKREGVRKCACLRRPVVHLSPP
jgi:hypothetical protein